MTSNELAKLNNDLLHGSPTQVGTAADRLAEIKSSIKPVFIHSLHDQLWRKVGEHGDDLIESTGTDPRNNVPSATVKTKGASPLVPTMMECRSTLRGITVETEGMRFAFYIDTHEWDWEKDAWVSTANLQGIWDVLNYMMIFPLWFLPIQIQPISHAVFFGPLCTVIETMVAEAALRIQSGLWEFVNNALSLNPDFRAWFGTLLLSNGNIAQMLKTPMYVVRHNPFTDTSPLVCKTVRMESCGTTIKDITRAYGVDVRVDLWMPGDTQPDPWANLDQPTYVVTVHDRSQVTGPTGTILDSVIRTVVDLEGSLLGSALQPLLNPQGQYAPEGIFIAPTLGVNFVAPFVILEAPEPGQKSALLKCKIVDHTPKGWRHIIGGKSPKWLNDLINAFFSWLIDSVSILLGVTGIPSSLLDGFLNDAFFAFQLADNFDRRRAVGPYHPAMERFTATGNAPYNIESLFTFINALWDSRGYTAAIASFRNGDGYALGRDIFRGGLVSLVYMGRRLMFTDYVDLIMWRITEKEREVLITVGDGKAIEAPAAKHQRFITGLQEAVNVLTLAPSN